MTGTVRTGQLCEAGAARPEGARSQHGPAARRPLPSRGAPSKPAGQRPRPGLRRALRPAAAEAIGWGSSRVARRAAVRSGPAPGRAPREIRPLLTGGRPRGCVSRS